MTIVILMILYNDIDVRVAATSLKLEIRLRARSVGTNTRSVTEAFLRSSDWLMCSELGFFASSLISGLNNDAATLITIMLNTVLTGA